MLQRCVQRIASLIMDHRSARLEAIIAAASQTNTASQVNIKVANPKELSTTTCWKHQQLKHGDGLDRQDKPNYGFQPIPAMCLPTGTQIKKIRTDIQDSKNCHSCTCIPLTIRQTKPQPHTYSHFYYIEYRYICQYKYT